MTSPRFCYLYDMFLLLYSRSQTGKHLMARCRTLLKENEELGMQISQGRIAKLEGEIALQKKLVEEMKVAQNGVYTNLLLSVYNLI